MDRYQALSQSLDGPAIGGFAVTPDDNQDLQEVTRGLYIGASGTVRGQCHDGTELEFENLSSGTLLPVRFRRILAAGTSATSLIGLV